MFITALWSAWSRCWVRIAVAVFTSVSRSHSAMSSMSLLGSNAAACSHAASTWEAESRKNASVEESD